MFPDITEWLLSSPRIAWKTDFSYLLTNSIEHATINSPDGFSLFIKGLNSELKEGNPERAYSFYRQAAAKLDPLALCRLHEAYLGDTFLKTTLDVDKAWLYLVFGGLYSQDVDFVDSIVPVKKLKAFINKFDPKCEMTKDVFERVNDHSINPAKELTYSLLLDFQNIEPEKQRNDVLTFMENLPARLQKDIIYTVYLSEFRLPWSHAVKKKENLVLKLMQNVELFQSFFESFKGLINLASINKTIAVKYRTWLQTVLFIIDFAALNPAKKRYYRELMPFASLALEKNMFESKEVQCWLRVFLAYCYEKGIEGEHNLPKALELIEKNITESNEGIKYPLRQALLLKSMGKLTGSRMAMDGFEDLYNLKVQQTENSLLMYSRGKGYEKYYDDIERAVGYYTKGAAELKEDTPQQTFFFYSYWRLRCIKKLEKLNARANGAVRHAISGILLQIKEEREEDESPQVPQQNQNLNELHKHDLFLQSKKFLTEQGIRVFTDKEINYVKGQARNTMTINKTTYYAEKFEIDKFDILKKQAEPLKQLFTEHNPKQVPAEGVYLKENGDNLAMIFLTPEFALDLHEVIGTNMFYDIKTKVHVAIQVAFCLVQIHEGNSGAYYGALKPKKILLDKYFTVKLHNSCIKMLKYQVLESDVYLAPEQLEGRDGPSSDIWALGRILWELLCDHRVEESQLKMGESKSLEGIENLIEKMVRNKSEQRVRIREVYETLTEIYNKIPRA